MNLKKLELVLSRKFKISSSMTPRCYILPDGNFLHLDEYTSHADVEHYMIQKKLVKEGPHSFDGGAPDLEDLGAIRCNLLSEGFVMLSEVPPTSAQYEALTKFFDAYLSRNSMWRYGSNLMLLTPHQKSNFKTYDLSVYTTDDLINIIRDYYSYGVLKEDFSLNEAKADQERFLAWAGQDLFDKFNSLKARLKSPENDIYYWMKKSPEELEATLDKVSSTATKSQSEINAKEGAEVVFEDSEWLVLKINTYEAAKKYGKGTKWCISGNYQDHESEGRYWFSFYTNNGALGYYFYIKKDTQEKWCVLPYPNGDVSLFDATDSQVVDIPGAPHIDGVFTGLNTDVLPLFVKSMLSMYAEILVDNYDEEVRAWGDDPKAAWLDSISSYSNFMKMLRQWMNGDQNDTSHDSEIVQVIGEAAANSEVFGDPTNIGVALNKYSTSLIFKYLYEVVCKEVKRAYKVTEEISEDMSAEQAEYFKNSLIKFPVYHSGYEDFKSFNEGKLIWFAKDEYYASELFGDGKHVYECYVNLTNPFRLDYCGDINDWFFDEDEPWPENFRFEDETVYSIPITETAKQIAKNLGVEIKVLVDMFVEQDFCDLNQLYFLTRSAEFAELLKQKGYDGVIADEGGYRTYGVLNANQIKRISNNKPTNSNNMDEDCTADLIESEAATQTDATDEEILAALDKEFGQEKIHMWSTYILPNGHCLNPDNSNDLMQAYEDGEFDLAYEHSDFLDWLWFNYKKGETFMEKYCCKMNVTYPYICIPTNRITAEQLQTIRQIIDYGEFEYNHWDAIERYENITGHKVNELEEMNKPLVIESTHDAKIYDLTYVSADEIIKDIQEFYRTGFFLNEKLSEAFKYIDFNHAAATMNDGTPFNIWTESTGGYSEQSNYTKIAYVGDNWIDRNDRIIRENILGYVDYAVIDDEEDTAYIMMIEVKDSMRRKGVGTALIESLKHDFKSLNWGFTTEDGTAFKTALGEALFSIREGKEFTYSDSTKRMLIKDFDQLKGLIGGYKLEKVPMSDIIRDTNIDKDVSMKDRRTDKWGEDPAKYHFKAEKNDWEVNNPIRLARENGKYRILDGNHRLRALANDGYTSVEAMVKDVATEELLFDKELNLDKDCSADKSIKESVDIDWDGRGWILPTGELYTTENGPHADYEAELWDYEGEVENIRYNFGYERYIKLPANKPTEAQFNKLAELLDVFFVNANNVGVRSTVVDIEFKGKISRFWPAETPVDELIKKIKAAYSSGSLKEYFGNTSGIEIFKEDLDSSEHKAITFGDLDYGKKTDTQHMMGGRGTGHFGTGFYFVGENGPYGLDDNGNIRYDYDKRRPVYEIDLEPYNLYKPTDNDTAYRIHDSMKVVNSMDDLDFKYVFKNNFDEDLIEDEMYQIGEKAYSVYESLHEDVPDNDLDDLDIDLDAFDVEEPVIDKTGKPELTDEEKDQEYERVFKSGIKDFINKYDLEPYIWDYGDLDNWLNTTKLGVIETEVVRAIKKRASDIRSLEYHIADLAEIFGQTRDNMLEIIESCISDGDDVNTTSTKIFKNLGYDGVDVTHLNHDAQGLSGLDNFSYGTVIYDLKPGTYRRIIEPRA